MLLSHSSLPSDGFESEAEGESKTPLSRDHNEAQAMAFSQEQRSRSTCPSSRYTAFPARQRHQPVQSIGAVLSDADYCDRVSTAFHGQPDLIESRLNVQQFEEDEFARLERLIEAYEDACADLNFSRLLSLPLPRDPDDIWCDVEDAAIRSENWFCFVRLMYKFGKSFTTDFIADIVSSEYEDRQKAEVVSLALHHGWDINSPKTEGGYILSDASRTESLNIVAYLLHCGANPNNYVSDISLDPPDPYITNTGLPLQDAILYSSSPTLIIILLQAGACPRLANAFHTAIRSDDNQAAKIKLLLNFGIDGNVREWDGNPVMRGLLDDAELRRGRPIEVAYGLGRKDVVRLLLDTSTILELDVQMDEVKQGNEKMPRKVSRREKRLGTVSSMGKRLEVWMGTGNSKTKTRNGNGNRSERHWKLRDSARSIWVDRGSSGLKAKT